MSDPARGRSAPAIYVALCAAVLAYAAVAGEAVFWAGLVLMLALYGSFYYLGVVRAGRGRATLGELMLAGRRLPLWVAAFTMTATWVGGGYVNGTAEYAYDAGLVWVQAPWCYALSLVLGGIFFARPMRRLGFVTLLDPLEARFGRRVTAALYVPALLGEVFWSAAILTALGTTFGTLIGLDFTASIVLSAAVAIGYTAVAGLRAVAMTDVLQLALIALGLALVLPFALARTGGMEATWQAYGANMAAEGSGLTRLVPPWDGWRQPGWGIAWWRWWDAALTLTLGGIPWQVYFQRALATGSPQAAMWFSIIAGVLAAALAIPPALIGIIGNVVDWSALAAPAPESPAMVLPWVLRYMTPELIAALALAALAAAVMSSADSSILSASSLTAWNVYRPLVRPSATADHLKRVMRRSIVLIGVGATLIALNVDSVYALWYLSSDFIYCMLFPQLAMALFVRRANRTGAIAGLAVAAVLRLGAGEPAVGLPTLLPYPTDAEGVAFPFRTTTMLASLATIYLVSVLSARADPARSLHPRSHLD